MASEILNTIIIVVSTFTALLATITGIITFRNRREIYRAEKRRAVEMLLRTRIARDSEPNLHEDEHVLVARR